MDRREDRAKNSEELNRRLAESDGPLGVRDEDEQGTSYGPLWVADGDPRIFTEDAEFTVAQAREQALFWWAAAAAAERNRMERLADDVEHGDCVPVPGSLEARGDFEGLQVEWRVYLIREGAGWSAVIPGTPIAADGATREEAVGEMVDAMRDYAEVWHADLGATPNHAANKNLVDIIDGETDESLRKWVAARDCGDAQREYDTSPVLRDALRRAREARSVKRVFRRRDE